MALIFRLLIWSCLWLGGALIGYAQISGNYTLTSDTTATSTAGTTFTVGTSSANTLDLKSFTATLTGAGDFLFYSQIKGTASGHMYIDLTDPTRVVTYTAGNLFSGLTEIHGGILDLQTPDNKNSGIEGDIIIGGGPNQAILTRGQVNNHNIIANNKTVTLKQNGVFELNREASGTTVANSSSETVGTFIMNGGTLLNASPNPNATAFAASTFTLSSDSVIDLGVATSLSLGTPSSWTAGVHLTFQDWDWGSLTPQDSILFGSTLTASQLGEIRFLTADGGYRGAVQLSDKHVVPVPEASSILALPLLGIVAFCRECRNRRKRGAQRHEEEKPVFNPTPHRFNSLK
jgi:hypothetical protein